MIRVPLAVFVVLIAALSGCASLHQLQDPDFRKAASLEQDDEFKEAAETYERIAARYPGTARGADALFEAGKARVRHDNPQKEYQRALQDFDEFLQKYPDSPHAEEAQNWRFFIKTILDLRKENERLSTSIEELKRVDIRHEERRRQ